MRTKKLAALVAIGLICIALGIFFSSYQFFILGWIFLLFCWLPWRDLDAETRIERAPEPIYMREGDQHDIKMRMKGTTPVGSLVTIADDVPEGVLVSHGSDLVLTSRSVETKDAPLWKRGYGLYFPHFGRFRVGPLKTSIWDPFALYVSEGDIEATENFTIYPTFRNLSNLPGVFTKYKHHQSYYRLRKPGIGSEFFQIRDYQPGDAMKTINWKAYAKYKKKMVNVKEKEVSCSAILIMDTRSANSVGSRRHNPLSWSISSALSLTSYLLKTRNEVGVLTYGDDLYFIPPSGSPVQMNRIQELLIDVEPAGAIPFGAALEVAIREMSPSTVLFLFSSLISDPSLMDSLYYARLKGIDITIITPPAEFFDRVLSDPKLYEIKQDKKTKRKFRLLKKKEEEEPEEEEEEEDFDLSNTIGYEMMMMRRKNYLKDLQNMGIRVVDWRPDTPIEKLLEMLK